MSKKNKTLSTVQIEKRFSFFRMLLAASVALLFCFLMIAVSSTNLLADIVTFLTAPLSSTTQFCTFLIRLSPLLFTSCATCLLFQANINNLAVEGAFYIGAIASMTVGTLDGIPTIIHFPLMALAGAAAATLVLLIPAVLSYKFNANIVVSSLMLNYVCTYLGAYLVKGPLRDPGAGYEATAKIASSAQLFKWLRFGGSTVHAGLLIGVAVVVVTFVILYKTKFGYQARTVGANPSFAKFSGISIGKVMILASVIAGIFTGLGSAAEMSGRYQRLTWLASPGYGWDGIMIATLARNNPLYVIPAGIFLAYVRTSADALNMTSVIPIEIVSVAQQVVIVMIAARGLMSGLEKRTIVKNAQKQIQNQNQEV